uniref:Integrase, catalytic region, zinc finger, CCHC-type, peptidase aspartic, catalytic n=1 Tax=Tanacetum cinerariifolium TaxID=118510 RepID=A0A6L2J8V5_TANCI|nr:hypothetical protein [Tanacetum cinerariifolium]
MGETFHEYYLHFAQLINDMHKTGMTMQQVYVNTKFLNALPLEWSKFVTGVKLAKNMYTTNYDQLYSYVSQHDGHVNEISYSTPLVPHSAYHSPIISPQQQAEFPQLDSGLAALGEGNMARQCTQPKRPRNVAWFKEKMLLAHAQESGQVLDKEQLEFLVDPRITDCYDVQPIIIHNAAFQTDDLDAYELDCDDISSTKVEFFTINEWQAKLDVKDVSTAKLKKHIKSLKGKNVIENDTTMNKAKIIAPKMFKLDLELLAPKVLKNRDAHLDCIKHVREHADTLRKIVKHARALRPLDSDLDSACNEDLGKLKPKADIEIFVGYAPAKRLTESTTREPFMTHAKYSFPTSYVPPTKKDWDLLFQPMFDEYFNPPPSVASPVPTTVAPDLADLIDSPSSTSIDQDAPSSSTSQTPQET